MTTEIEIQRLIKFETATDGTAVKLIVRDVSNHTVGIILTIEALSALLMTLPMMASNAVKRAQQLKSAHLVGGCGIGRAFGPGGETACNCKCDCAECAG
jgi:hypothetical protein